MLRAIGIEEEFLLVTTKLEQGHIESDMLTAILAEGSGVSPEVFDSHLEVQTPPCTSFIRLRDEIRQGRLRAQTLANTHDHAICAAGTLACYDWSQVKALPFPRVQSIVGDFGDAFQSQPIAALHLHVKMDTLAESLAMVNNLSWYLWLFLALSGSSRFNDHRDTKMSSRRVSLIGQTQRTGMAPYYQSEQDYEGEQRALALTGWEKNKLWYYLRHNPHHDTVELRIMDAIPLVEDVLAVSALFTCLCSALESGLLEPVPMNDSMNRVVAQVNIERAMCSGVKAQAHSGTPVNYFVIPEREVTFEAAVETLLGTLIPVARGLNCEEELKGVLRIASRGNSAMRQYHTYHEYGSLEATVRLVMNETLQDL